MIVPEINADILTTNDKIIANPNCSTIQLVMVLNPLHKKYGIKRVVVSTYQSVTGTGKDAVEQLNGEIEGRDVAKVYPYQIFKNALPHCDVFDEETGYTKEELKLTREPRKIMRVDEMNITDLQRKAFCFYTLMYCVNFMGERGTQYNDRVVEVNQRIIDRLNMIYDQLWNEWRSL